MSSLVSPSPSASPPTGAGSPARSGLSPVARAERSLAAIAASDRTEVWITLRDPSAVLAEASLVEHRIAAGEHLPLAGWTVAVKDNIDVAGLPTTSGCPAFAAVAHRDADAVARLRGAGAVVLGKTSLDQFATGLVGTRSPYGAVRDARDPTLVSGGSSSGSAVAVALGIADLALATDTAGSGRIPAAFQGIVGVKPTIGLVSTEGLTPACRSFDCVSVFAATLWAAERALAVLTEAGGQAGANGDGHGGHAGHAGHAGGGHAGGGWPADAPLAARPIPRVATFPADGLTDLCPEYRSALSQAIDRVRATGAEISEIDPAPFLSAGELLYEGAFVAERYAAVGRFVEMHLAQVDPSVAAIVLGGRDISAAAYVKDVARLAGLRAAALASLQGIDALLLPTAPWQPTIAAVEAQPIELNRGLGRYVTFCNLIGLCAVSLPAGDTAAGHFGVTLYGAAHHDAALTELAGRLAPALSPAVPAADADDGLCGAPAVELLVLGAHLRGQPLNHQLTDRGARFLQQVRTASGYRLYCLQTAPLKPGLVRETDGGATHGLAGELWAVPPAGITTLLQTLPRPMALGAVALSDGREVVGFLCEPAALAGAEDITRFGGWREYLATR